MSEKRKGFLYTFLVMLSFMIIGGLLAYLSAGGNSCPECSGWAVVGFIWVGLPLTMIVSFVVGYVKYFRSKSEFSKGIMLASPSVILLMIVLSMLVFSLNFL